jgi:hypothetical protein
VRNGKKICCKHVEGKSRVVVCIVCVCVCVFFSFFLFTGGTCVRACIIMHHIIEKNPSVEKKGEL